MMLDATAKNAAPNGAREVAPDLAVLDGFEVLPEPEAPEPAAVVLAAVLDVAELGYKRELVYVVQDEVAGMTGLPPGGAWFSPRHEVNSLGAYEAGMLNEQPCVSNTLLQ